jgi:hypothetical protein
MAPELTPDNLGVLGGKWYEDEVFELDEAAFAEWHRGFITGS